MKVRLSVQHKKANVKSVVLHTDALIGRSTECNLRLASGQVSRRHCKLLISDEQVAVIDLGSSNGTYLNDEKITPKVEIPIPPGSELSIGPARFVVQYDDPTAETHIRKGTSSTADSEEEGSSSGNEVEFNEMPTAEAVPVFAADEPAETDSEDEEGEIEISDEELEALLREEGFDAEDSSGVEFPLEDDAQHKSSPTSETQSMTLSEKEPAPEDFPLDSSEGSTSKGDREPGEDDDDEEDLMNFLQDMD